MRADWMCYNDRAYHILSRERESIARTKVLCGKEKIVPLGYYADYEEDDLPLPEIPCIDCKCMKTMLELAK